MVVIDGVYVALVPDGTSVTFDVKLSVDICHWYSPVIDPPVIDSSGAKTPRLKHTTADVGVTVPPSKLTTLISIGSVVVYFNVSDDDAREALRRAAHKLSVPTRIVSRSDEF